MAFWAGSAGSTPQQTFNLKNELVIENPVVEKSVKDIVLEASIKYGQPFDEIWDTIGGETQWTYNPLMQSNVIYNFSDQRRNITIGTREKSFGLAMIHLPDHPDVTYASATDAYFSADFIAKNWAKHKCWWYYYANKHPEKCIR